MNVYRASESFPARETYGLTAQLRRACLSIELNIAEGCGRGRPGQLHWFLEIASGSVSEVDCGLEVCRDLGYLQPEGHAELELAVTEIRKMLWSLRDQVLKGRGGHS